MRVALVINYFDPRSGGAERWTCDFAERLLRAGHEVHVVAERFGDTSAPSVVRHLVPRSRSRGEFAQQAEAVLKRLSVDIVHDMGAGWACDVMQPHGGSRTALFRQNLLLEPRWLRGLKRRVAPWLPRYRDFQSLAGRQFADDGRQVIAISRMVAGHLQSLHDVPANRLHIVHNGVDVKHFHPGLRNRHREARRAQLGVRDQDIVCLIVAHNFALKGVPTAVRAVRRLRREGLPIHLAIAGGKPRRVRLRELVQRDPGVTFLGPVPDAASWYAAADIYVQPTYYDPCSLVVLEALACGLPVVTTQFNGAGELITPGQEGFLQQDPANDLELADLLRPLLDSKRRADCGEMARELALQHTWERNFQEVVAVYRHVPGRSRAAG